MSRDAVPITRLCPICRRETDWTENPSRPFCSERCRLTDLGRWASEEYRVPAGPQPDTEDDSHE